MKKSDRLTFPAQTTDWRVFVNLYQARLPKEKEKQRVE
jgi:hypothetical protein